MFFEGRDRVHDDDIAVEYPPTYIGPTWQRDDGGNFVLPQHTLGWEIAGWCSQYLLAPDSQDGEPWRFTFEQLRFVLWWYAVDERGKFIYREGTLQRLKGWGKDPLAAVMSLVELCGPSRFSHWETDERGRRVPVGKPVPQAWVEVYAVSKEQTRNTLSMIPTLMSDEFKAEYSVSAGREIIYANGGKCGLYAKSAGHRAAEGGRVTFMVLGETQHWVASNGGHALYDTVVNNATKMDARYLAITNAYLPGENSIGERMREQHELVQSGKARDVGVLYDSIEAHPKTPMVFDVLEQVIPVIRGDAVWLNVEAILARIGNTTTSVARSRRMWLNQIVADEDALYAPQEWDALRRPLRMLRPGDRVVLGFDGGRVDDATALVAIRVEDKSVWPLLIEERDPDVEDWEIDRDMVDHAVHRAFEQYEVEAFFADVALWESYISEWSRDYGHRLKIGGGGRNKIGWDMRGAGDKVTVANELTMRMVRDGMLSWADLDPERDVREYKLAQTLRMHLLNARRRENKVGVSFGKETKDSPKKVDGYAALVLAVAALDAVGSKTGKRQTYRAWRF